ncbi:hypothetical protein OROGR_025053 [Orobanche gracilis]
MMPARVWTLAETWEVVDKLQVVSVMNSSKEVALQGIRSLLMLGLIRGDMIFVTGGVLIWSSTFCCIVVLVGFEPVNFVLSLFFSYTRTPRGLESARSLFGSSLAFLLSGLVVEKLCGLWRFVDRLAAEGVEDERVSAHDAGQMGFRFHFWFEFRRLRQGGPRRLSGGVPVTAACITHHGFRCSVWASGLEKPTLVENVGPCLGCMVVLVVAFLTSPRLEASMAKIFWRLEKPEMGLYGELCLDEAKSDINVVFFCV